ncbi:MAG: response regulator [Betaproteobacteria bacterium]
MQSNPHILVVDDDVEICRLLKQYLEKSSLRVSTVCDGRQMQRALDQAKFDLIVLDLMLPGDDGLTLLRRLRTHTSTPVIMLTAMGEEADRIVGLELGADDYLPKPFSPRELLARVRAVLKRIKAGGAAGDDEGVKGFKFNGWSINHLLREVTSPTGVLVPLSSGEYKLLHIFLSRPNRVLSRDFLLDMTQGRESGPLDRSIDVLVSRLRIRLEDDARNPTFLKTIRGEGYLFAADVDVVR